MANATVIQVVFAPFRNPPYAPSTMVHSPADVVECLCICLQILIVGCGIIGYTTRYVDDNDMKRGLYCEA
eukprot:SAG25_NODE_630_length_6325_cov_14.712175_5_plen_70_part_00